VVGNIPILATDPKQSSSYTVQRLTLMRNRTGVRRTRFRRRILTFAIVAVLMAIFSVPIAIILYGGAGAAIGGLIVIGALIVIQLPAFMLLRRLGVLPSIDRNDDRS